MKVVYLLILFLGMNAVANTDHRQWDIPGHGKIIASLVEVDDKSQTITLKFRGSHKRLDVPQELLSSTDKEFIQRHREFEKELDVIADKLKGNIQRRTVVGEYSTDYHVYFPSSYHSDDYLPLVLLFSSSGREKNLLYRHMTAAEKVGFILVCPDKFRNTHNEPSFDRELESRFQDLVKDIKATIPFDHSYFYMGGDSGGAYRAYHYSYQFEGPWAGIYANVGWLGGRSFYNKNYPAGMRIAMVNGHLDNSSWTEPDKSLLESKGNEVKVFIFEGGHQLAPIRAQVKSFSWMMEGKKPYKGLTEDKQLFRGQEEVNGSKYSSIEALRAAMNIYDNVNLRGKSRDAILELLGSPRTLNDFAFPFDKDTKDSPLVYVIKTVESEYHLQLEFEESLVNDISFVAR